jgi:hypothetical protein
MHRTSISWIPKYLFFALCLSLIPAVPMLQAQTFLLHPIQDTYIYTGEPDTAHGDLEAVVTGVSTSMNPYAYSYLKFNLGSIATAQILSATLFMYQVDGNAPFAEGGTNVYRMNTNSWDESTLTWNSAPSSANTLFGSSPDSGNHDGWSSWTWTPSLGDLNLDTTPSDNILSLFVAEDMHTAQGHAWLSKDYSTATWGSGFEPYLVVTTSTTALSLNNNRFTVEVDWHTLAGDTGSGFAVPLTSDTGYFWFFENTNVELLVKLLDKRAVNGHFWFFWGAMTDVEYTITVTDTETSDVKHYYGTQGLQQSGNDINAF